jgi:hypothetical protein
MNHTRSVFHAPGVPSFPFESWEVRQGGFRRTAILLTGGFLPSDAIPSLREALLSRYFKVYAPAFPELRTGKGKPAGLEELIRGLHAFAVSARKGDGGVPMVAIAASFLCLPFMAALGRDFPPLESIALLSPVVDFARTPLAVPLFLRRWVTVRPPEGALGSPEELKVMGDRIVPELRMPKRLIKGMRRLSQPPAGRKGDTIAVFTGEADPIMAGNPAGKWAEGIGAEVHSYPRGTHLLFFDKHSENVLRDLCSFLDRSAARKASR